jgi:hypothetical protein
LHQSAQRHQFQLVVVLRLGSDRLARGLADFELERLGVADPPAVLESLLQVGENAERVGAATQLGQAVRLPVERGVGPRRLQLDQPIEAIDGAVVLALFDRFAAVAIELVGALLGALVRVEPGAVAQRHADARRRPHRARSDGT